MRGKKIPPSKGMPLVQVNPRASNEMGTRYLVMAGALVGVGKMISRANFTNKTSGILFNFV